MGGNKGRGSCSTLGLPKIIIIIFSRKGERVVAVDAYGVPKASVLITPPLPLQKSILPIFINLR